VSFQNGVQPGRYHLGSKFYPLTTVMAILEIFFVLHQLKTIAAILETEYQLFSQQMITDYIM